MIAATGAVQTGGVQVGPGAAVGGDTVGRDKITYVGVAPPATSLHQLPRPVDDFTGREAELGELRAAVRERGVTISGVRGMGGVGKTQLALKLAHELRPLYPHAQIYLDLQGVSTEPLSPATAMAHVVRAFHPATPLPEREAELAGLYRAVLDDKSVCCSWTTPQAASRLSRLFRPPAAC